MGKHAAKLWRMAEKIFIHTRRIFKTCRNMSNSDLKYFGNIRNRKTTGKWPLKYLVNCQHSLTEHEVWQQLPGLLCQEPYAKTPGLTESHIFSVEIFPMVCLSQTLLSSPHGAPLSWPQRWGLQLSLSQWEQCLCQTSQCGRGEIIPAPALQSRPAVQCVGGTGTAGSAALQIIALFELRDWLLSSGFTDNKTMNIQWESKIFSSFHH